MNAGDVYEFGRWGEYPFRYSVQEGLSKQGEPLHLTPFERALLELLLEEAPDELKRSDLESRLWPEGMPRGGSGGANALNAHASNLRKKLGDEEDRLFQRTSAGYRWVGSVRTIPVASARVPSVADGQAVATATIRPHLFVPVAAGVAGLHQLLAELAEVAFVSGRIGLFAPIALVNCAVVATAGAIGLRQDSVLTRKQRTTALMASVGVVAFSLAAIAAIAWSFLPPQLEIRIAGFGMVPHVGFLKSAVVYQALLSVLFLHMPFHFVMMLDAEILAGRRDNVVALIAGRSDAVARAEGLFFRPERLWLIFVICLAFGIPMTVNLLSGVAQGSEGRLFSLLAIGRFLAWWGGATFGACWYAAQVNDLKRRALA